MKRILEMKVHNGCTTWIYLILLNCTVKRVKIVSFMCIYHSKKNGKKMKDVSKNKRIEIRRTDNFPRSSDTNSVCLLWPQKIWRTRTSCSHPRPSPQTPVPTIFWHSPCSNHTTLLAIPSCNCFWHLGLDELLPGVHMCHSPHYLLYPGPSCHTAEETESSSVGEDCHEIWKKYDNTSNLW